MSSSRSFGTALDEVALNAGAPATGEVDGKSDASSSNGGNVAKKDIREGAAALEEQMRREARTSGRALDHDASSLLLTESRIGVANVDRSIFEIELMDCKQNNVDIKDLVAAEERKLGVSIVGFRRALPAFDEKIAAANKEKTDAIQSILDQLAALGTYKQEMGKAKSANAEEGKALFSAFSAADAEVRRLENEKTSKAGKFVAKKVARDLTADHVKVVGAKDAEITTLRSHLTSLLTEVDAHHEAEKRRYENFRATIKARMPGA